MMKGGSSDRKISDYRRRNLEQGKNTNMVRSRRTMEHAVSIGDMHNMPGGHSQLLHLYVASLMPMSTELPWTHHTWVFRKTQSEYKYRVVAGKQLPSLGLHSEPSPKECERKQYVLYLV